MLTMVPHSGDPSLCSGRRGESHYFISLRDRIAHVLDLEQSQIDTLSDVNKEMNTECSWDFLGSWNDDDHAFQRFCSALAKATDLEQINLRFFAPSLKNTELFISAIRANPSVKINLFNCGEVLTDAMREIQKERPESINIKNLTHFQKVGSLAKPKPFLIEDIDPRIIYGFVAALGLLAIVCALIVLPVSILNPITATVATAGVAALALGVCGLFSPVKQREPEEDLLLSNRLNRSY